ncbi:MAG: PpGpp synthetase/hydrolase Rel [Parcubacteria group bacterium GW2011_GWA1_47_8]|nr:MAG: PpGpp synthetase/hydrolase Rel [Parcubacteria group bacterium GW2011_GWA1_47_8]KKW08067.1 MAG: PpGpp synthetase/hydrolase Rel [Parcubacteria group bacterium GW2011_GWA2_49_16]
MEKTTKNPLCPSVAEILALLKTPTKADFALIEKAYTFAKKAHEGQKRYSGEPYFNHVANVGYNLANIHVDTTTIAAGLLHDTLEDAAILPKTIEAEFGKEIRKLVEGATKLGKIRYRGVERHVESLRKFFVAMSQDVRVLLIKLADRLHNIKTLEHVPEAKRRRIAMETLEVHARLADRFGMGKWRAMFEDYAFPYAYPDEHAKILSIIKNKRITDEKYAEKIYRSIQKELAANNLIPVKVDYRVKNIYSLWRKLSKREMDLNKIYDILAVRVIVKTVDECYRALGIIHKHWRPVPGRVKDHIAVSKPNGYRSLHTTIFRGDGGVIEIQIRTKEMHAEAEYGIASHLSYKEKALQGTDFEKNNAWIKELAKWQKDIDTSKEFLENLQMDFFKYRVFVFTPKGDVIDLPDESTPIDFAYAIHSNIGDHVAGAKINGKLVSLDTKLKNGDIVLIETKESATPRRKWIDYAKTTLAKRHIRSYLEKTSPIEIIARKFFRKK